MEFNSPSPYEAITGSDVFLDGSLPFPVTATTVGQGTPPNSSQLTDVFTSVTSKTGQQTLNAGSVGYHGGVPTITTVTHTFLSKLTPQGPFHLTNLWSTTSNLSVPDPSLAVSSSSCSSVSVSAALPCSPVRHKANQSISSRLTSFSNRLGTLENIANKSNSPVISLRPDHDIGSDPEDSDEEERFSVAPGSQEEGFTSDEEDDNSVQVSQNVSQPSVPVSISSSVIGQSSTNSSKDPEAEDTPSTLKDLRHSVYTIMRDVNKVSFQSPPKPKKLTSTSRLHVVDKALGASQLLIMGSIANCTLSKRSEILDKAKVSDKILNEVVIFPLEAHIIILKRRGGKSQTMERIRSLRTSSNSRLFVHINKGKQDLTAKTFSTGICKTIQLAYSFFNEELLNSMHVKAHDVGAISTSLALFNNASLEEVLSAGFWRTKNSFISHYLQSLATPAQSLYSLGPLVSAQRVVFLLHLLVQGIQLCVRFYILLRIYDGNVFIDIKLYMFKVK
ncbi:unnamed protein product [Mytilus edulis]|uniref:Uncharacterized protein n=1 Tax=Mytilus edulis TaxID=6550 RepID=A0A8S3QJV6_MYTED|nr:unnamed protein product [Mytilus edulis]